MCRGFARNRLTWIGIEGDGKAARQPSRLGAALAAFTSLRGLGWSTGCRSHHLPDPLPRDYGPFFSALVGRIVWFQAICVANTWLVATSERSRDGTLRPLLAQLGYPDAPMWLCHLLIGLGIGQAAWSGLEVRRSRRERRSPLQLGNACVTLIAFVGTVVLRTLLPASLAPAPFVTRMWPPLMRPPHLATSVGRFWTKCWHALFATPFRFIAYDPSLRVVERLSPGNRALGQLVGTLAVFTLSGLMHDYGIGAGVGPRAYSVGASWLTRQRLGANCRLGPGGRSRARHGSSRKGSCASPSCAGAEAAGSFSNARSPGSLAAASMGRSVGSGPSAG